MPELPEVHTTATILNKLVKGRVIKSVETDYNSKYFYGKENIKDPKYFRQFVREIKGKKIKRVWRRAKNVLIDIEGDQTILIHMKMTGQLLYGKYKRTTRKDADFKWQAANEKSPLRDPFSRFIHLIFELDNGQHIAFSDMRKFGTVKLITDKNAYSREFDKVGPEPLDDEFDFKTFKKVILKKPSGYIKTVLMDPFVVSGIGNIYSDEILFAAKILPNRKVSSLSDPELRAIFKNTKKLLSKGIDLGGDSMSDYRNPYGKKGSFQLHHQVYQRKNEKCLRRGCDGKITRTVINGRSSHYCPECQK
jgi:formamidopyrimidine-DNA glycosylase